MTRTLLFTLGLAVTAPLVWSPAAHAQSITAASDAKIEASFDIVETRVTTAGDSAIFHTRVRADAGKSTPKPTGKFPGAEVYAYVWPTSLNSADVGFDKDQGIVALAATFHPDFDDGAKARRTMTAGTRTGWCSPRTRPAPAA
jgi:hypothetical protein